MCVCVCVGGGGGGGAKFTFFPGNRKMLHD